MKNKILIIVPASIQLILAVLGLFGSLVLILPKLNFYPWLLIFLLIPIVSLLLSVGLFKNNNLAIISTPYVSLLFLLINIFYGFKKGFSAADYLATLLLVICIAFPVIYQFKNESI